MAARVENEAAARKPCGSNGGIEYIPNALAAHGGIRPLAGEKKIVFRSVRIAFLYIFGQDLQRFPGEDGITLGTVLGFPDEDGAIGPMDVATAEPA